MDRKALLQLRVLRFGLLQDGDVGVGVFPEREEILVGGERSDAGGVGVRTLSLRGSRLQGVGAGHSQMRQRSRPAVPNDAAVVDDLLELGWCITNAPTLRRAADAKKLPESQDNHSP